MFCIPMGLFVFLRIWSPGSVSWLQYIITISPYFAAQIVPDLAGGAPSAVSFQQISVALPDPAPHIKGRVHMWQVYQEIGLL